MSNDITRMAQDMQNHIRDLAYLMWEAAGHQQGLAMQYWLDAEKQVLATMQAAAADLAPTRGGADASSAKKEGTPSARKKTK